MDCAHSSEDVSQTKPSTEKPLMDVRSPALAGYGLRVVPGENGLGTSVDE
jgi:hypothetical protein